MDIGYEEGMIMNRKRNYYLRLRVLESNRISKKATTSRERLLPDADAHSKISSKSGRD